MEKFVNRRGMQTFRFDPVSHASVMTAKGHALEVNDFYRNHGCRTIFIKASREYIVLWASEDTTFLTAPVGEYE